MHLGYQGCWKRFGPSHTGAGSWVDLSPLASSLFLSAVRGAVNKSYLFQSSRWRGVETMKAPRQWSVAGPGRMLPGPRSQFCLVELETKVLKPQPPNYLPSHLFNWCCLTRTGTIRNTPFSKYMF